MVFVDSILEAAGVGVLQFLISLAYLPKEGHRKDVPSYAGISSPILCAFTSASRDPSCIAACFYPPAAPLPPPGLAGLSVHSLLLLLALGSPRDSPLAAATHA